MPSKNECIPAVRQSPGAPLDTELRFKPPGRHAVIRCRTRHQAARVIHTAPTHLIGGRRTGTVINMCAPDSVPSSPMAGVGSGRFEGTRWSLVVRAGAESSGALNTLFTTYRRPLLSYLLGRGHQPADAEDLLNGFYAALLRRDFLQNVSATKGRFRTFLLRSLDHYREDERAKAAAGKRGGGVSVDPIGPPDETGGPGVDPADRRLLPDEAFDREWGLAVLRGAFRRLNEEYQRRGKAALCHALEPVLFEDANAPAYRELSQRLKMKEQALRTAASRMRGELREFIRAEIRETVDNPQDWEEECRHFLRIFGG